MTAAGQSVTQDFYGSAAVDSYFNGCSTGGRQALGEAQRYPLDYDGILGGAPAVYFDQLSAAQLWPEFVMLRADDFLPQCKFDAFRTAAISSCDRLDGVTDGVIGNVDACRFDANSLIGMVTPCGAITHADATVMDQIWQGPVTNGRHGRFLWYGIEPGTDSSGLANTRTSGGVTTGAPFSIATNWLKYWVTQDPTFDWQSLDLDQFVGLFNEGLQKFPQLTTANPDLSLFRAAGGKLVLWAGLSDQIIPPQGVIRYYNNVQQTMGGANATDAFARLFLAPGDGHCGGDSLGPVPSNQFDAVVSWVENGVAPYTLRATKSNSDGIVTQSLPLCSYPLVARYLGHGSTDDAANFYCDTSFGRTNGGAHSS